MGRKDYIGGGIFTALGVFIWALTFQFPVLDDGHPGPSLFPRVLGTLFIFFGLMVVFNGWKSRRATEETPPDEGLPLNYFNPILVIILIAAFIALAPKVGFIISGAAILFFLMIKLRVSPLKRLIVSIVLICLSSSSFPRACGCPCQSDI